MQLLVELGQQRFDLALLLGREAGQQGRPPGGQLRLHPLHRAGQGIPALGPQVVAGGLQAMLQALELGGLDRQGVAQDRRRIGDGIPLGQGRPGARGCQ